MRDGAGGVELTGADAETIGGILRRATGVLVYDMVLPPWSRMLPGEPIGLFRNRIPRGSKCYRLASGARVHVKPGCRC